MGQNFEITVPNANVTFTAGAGAVDGITLTTAESAFHYSNKNSSVEASKNVRIIAGQALGAVAGAGVVIGTPRTIHATAGHAVQIYAGAGSSPSLGNPSGPGGAAEASAAPEIGAGKRAKGLNKLNDQINTGVNMAEARSGMGSEDRVKRLKAYRDFISGANDLSESLVSESQSSRGEEEASGSSALSNVAEAGSAVVDVVDVISSDDPADMFIGALGLVGKELGARVEAADAGDGLDDATAASGGTREDGEEGDGEEPPEDGYRIHEVAPDTIDRECGKSMTAKVGGDKTADVDGHIKYQSGKSISLKAFNKVSTQSLFFSAHANVAAKVTGFAQAKVESLGKAVLDGKVRVQVSTKGKGKIKAGAKLDISTDGPLDMGAKAFMKIKAGTVMTLSAPDVAITGKKKFRAKAPKIQLNGETLITKDTAVKGVLRVNKDLTAKGDVKGNATIKNKYFKAG